MTEKAPCPYDALLEDPYFQAEWFERTIVLPRFFSDSQKERVIIQHLDRMSLKPGGVYATSMLDTVAKLAKARCCEYWRNAHEREDLEVTLENDGRFYAEYTKHLHLGRGLSERVCCVQHWIKQLVPNWCSHPVPGKDYDQARTLALYFDERYGKEKPVLSNPCCEINLSHDDFKDAVIYASAYCTTNSEGLISGFGLSPNTPPENTMSQATAITITTKTFANGNDISTMSDSAIYDLIAQQEAALRELDKIEAKPKKLLAEITKRQAGIKALVDYLDSKE